MLTSNIGVDIGSSSIKAVQCGAGRHRKKILRAAQMPLPERAVVAGEIRDIQAVSETLRALRKRGGFTGRTAVIGLSGSQTLVRQVDLPWEVKRTFRAALPLRLAHELPADSSEMVLDYYPLREHEQRGLLTQNALIVGAMNAASENAVAALRKARMHPRRADYSPFALIRADVACDDEWTHVPHLNDADDHPACVIIDIGAQMTTVIVHDDGRPQFIRAVPVGSFAVTQALADQLRLDIRVAEGLKKQLGLGAVAPAESRDDNDAPDAVKRAGQQVINAMAGSLVQVARESVEYFFSATGHDAGTKRVTLTGGGALLPGLVDRVAAEMKAPAAPLRSLGDSSSVRMSDDTLDPVYATAHGLAMKVGR